MTQWQRSGPLHLMEMMEMAEQQGQNEERNQRAENEADAAISFAIGARDGFTPVQREFRDAFAKLRKNPYGSQRGFGFSIDTSGRKPNNT